MTILPPVEGCGENVLKLNVQYERRDSPQRFIVMKDRRGVRAGTHGISI